MDMNVIIVGGLATLAVACVLLVLAPYMSGDIKAEQRQDAVKSTVTRRGPDKVVKDSDARRKQVSESLKEIDQKNKGKKVSLETKFMQAGVKWSKLQYFLISFVMGIIFAALVYLITENYYMAPVAFLIGGLGAPAWMLSFMKKRRIKKFIEAFPGSIDIIVRGIKAGLPLGDCLRIIATEAPEPVRTEFRGIIEAQTIGLSVSEAVERIVERVPVAEASFFSIVIAIQQKAGGNLAEALGNLSRVLRERKKMKQKIQAMSSEAKSSAGIIGALPFIVTGLVYLTTPKYITLLFTEQTGHFVLACCAFWMFIGIMVMKKMINFDI